MGDNSEVSSNDVFPVIGEIAKGMAEHMAEIDRKLRARNARTFAAGLGFHPDDLTRPINEGEGEI